ncbi:MAG: VanZ family protein, partial [Halopseudomonas sp.]
MNQSSKTPDNPRRLMWLTALVYTAFVIYGSLVPLEFRAIPWDEAVARFTAIPWLELGVGSRANWVANLILYIPLGYLLMGAFAGQSKSPGVWGTGTLFSILLISAMAVSVEFVQQYFPPRTVSLNDLYAEIMGGVLGVLLWALAGRQLSCVLHRFAQGGPRAVRAALVVYVLAYLFLSLFPYDFLLSSEEWRAHLTSDRAGWLFAGNCGFGCWVKLVPEMLATLPFGLLLVKRSGRLSLAVAAAVGVLLGLTIEVMQLWIASGISQGASIFSRAAGVVLGATLPAFFRYWYARRMSSWVRAGLMLAVVPYAIGLAWLNNWFDAPWVNTDEAIDRLAKVRFIPFYYHYYTAEAVALVSLLFQLGLYSLIGVGMWLWRKETSMGARGAWFPALLAMFVASLIEAGKLFVPGQHPDPTNMLIAAGAAGGCYALFNGLFPAFRSTDPSFIASEATERRDMPKFDQAQSQSSPSTRLIPLSLVAAAVISMVGYPLGWVPLLLMLGLAAICWHWPGSWLLLVPAALPLLDFSYLSGRLFWSEFDTLLLLILAAAYTRQRVVPAMTWPGRIPLAFYVVSAFIGLLVGLLPLAPLGLNAFTQYTSSYHALHAAKGLAFALAFLPLIKTEWHKDSGQFTSRLALGMMLGLALELLYVLWERATYSGLWNFETDYRITGSFPGMHIGGASIEAYLV